MTYLKTECRKISYQQLCRDHITKVCHISLVLNCPNVPDMIQFIFLKRDEDYKKDIQTYNCSIINKSK